MTTKKAVDLSGVPGRIVTGWNDEEHFAGALEDILQCLCAEVNTPSSLSVSLLLKYKDYDRLLAFISAWDLLSDQEHYFEHAQIVGLIKKYPYWNVSLSPKVQAMKTFIACEVKCRDTNRRFWSPRASIANGAVNSILYMAQEKISSILGGSPQISDLDFAFGPGATYGVKYNTSPLFKLASTLDVTRDCYEYAELFLRTCPGWRANDLFLDPHAPCPKRLNIVSGDRLSFVPKTAKTDRPIAIGPTINVLLQKGIGAEIRRRLKPYNNLNNREGYHKLLARQASVDGTYCTIDLSSASDTIAYALVQSLLPQGWFDLLASTRSPTYEIDGKKYTYQKFSAMGNGYTFELESLIFYALAFATCKYLGLETECVTVFGDDIIAPTAAYEQLAQVLEYCGFELNSDKSFSSGPFRESCGGDYLSGVDVRPFYLKDRVTYRTLFLFHNFLVRTGRQFTLPDTYRKIRKLLGKEVCRAFRTWNDLEDGSLLDYSMVRSSYVAVKESIQGLRRSRLSKVYGISLLLYQLMLSDKESETDFKWEIERVRRKTKIRCKLYRHVHI